MEFKKSFQLVFLLAILFGLTNCQPKKNDAVANRKYKNEIINARKPLLFYLSRNSIPGASIAVSKEGKIIYSEGIGMASKDLDVKVTRSTKFRIGTVSQVFTSLAYQLLVENGTLHPDSSIHFYIPDFPKKEYKITLENLVQHTSGIRTENIGEQVQPTNNLRLIRGLDRFKNDDLLFTPGMYQSPSVYNYNLLGAIMEKATGKKFSEIISEMVTDTLNMENTVIDHPFSTINGRTDFFDHNLIMQVVNSTFRDLRYSAPSKGILSNAEDLVKFGNAILKSDYISENVKTKLFTPVNLGAGFTAQMSNGWLIGEDAKDRKFYACSGEVIGGGAILVLFPEEELVLAGTINTTMNLEELPLFELSGFFLDNLEENKMKKTRPQEIIDSDK